MPSQSAPTRLASFLTLLPLLSFGVAASGECQNENEQPLEFRFFTDNNSWKDNGWTLECTEHGEGSSPKLLWQTPIGSLEQQESTEVIRQSACVPNSSTCTLHIYDASGNGLTGGNSDNDFTGWFAFLHGATTVGTYKNLENPSFSELTYCVGPKCDKAPQEKQINDEDCQDVVYLAMQLDNKPQDTTYQLVCGSDETVVWNGSGFTEAGAYVEEETCLPKDVCCRFVVTDEDTQGLTSSIDTSDPSLSDGTKAEGFIYLERNFVPLLEYDGSTGTEFKILSKTFGSCSSEKTSILDQEESVEQNTEEFIKQKPNDIPVVPSDEDADGKEQGGDSTTLGNPTKIAEEDINEHTGERESSDGESSIEQYLNQFYKEKEQHTQEEATQKVDNQDKDVTAAEEYLTEFFAERVKSDEETQPPQQEPQQKEQVTAPEDASSDVDSADAFVDYENFQYEPFTDDSLVSNDYGDDFTDDLFDDQLFTDDVEIWNTEPPTKGRNPWDLYDDVLKDDDQSWAEVDDIEEDLAWTKEQLSELEKLVHKADESLPIQQEDEGLSLGAKIGVGVAIPLLILWSVALVLYFFRERLMERFGETTDDEVLEKASTGSEDTYSQDDIRSVSSLGEAV
ncbi:unnamed protein product [Pseudo-nitzschia multistriata]|uniref:Ig-like domain-containing protein n=1 Tax=Pseudo-nitzschia multistriata TaxID=183589 RepID=A0A448YXE8_9STRA|nr:unnamed protein product [Pseudo-nitzschia multistriata]